MAVDAEMDGADANGAASLASAELPSSPLASPAGEMAGAPARPKERSVSGRERHQLGVKMRRAIRTKVNGIKAERKSLGKLNSNKDRKRRLNGAMKALLVEEAVLKSGVVRGGGGKVLSQGVDPSDVVEGINRAIAEKTLGGLGMD